MSPQGHKLVLCTASPVFHQVGKYCIQNLWQRIRSMIPRYTYIQIYMLCNFEQKKYVDCSLVAQPTRWSPIVIWVFVGRSSSWPWEPHIRGCKLLKPVLRTQMAVFDPVFCKMYLLYRSCPRRKSFSSIFCLFPSQNDCFLQPLEGKDWDRTPNQDFTIIPVWGSARVNPKPGKLTTLQRKSILGALKVEIDFNFFSGLTKHVENVFFAKNGISFGQVLPREHHL